MTYMEEWPSQAGFMGHFSSRAITKYLEFVSQLLIVGEHLRVQLRSFSFGRGEPVFLTWRRGQSSGAWCEEKLTVVEE